MHEELGVTGQLLSLQRLCLLQTSAGSCVCRRLMSCSESVVVGQMLSWFLCILNASGSFFFCEGQVCQSSFCILLGGSSRWDWFCGGFVPYYYTSKYGWCLFSVFVTGFMFLMSLFFFKLQKAELGDVHCIIYSTMIFPQFF